MLILAINTASSKTSIALLQREKSSIKILTEKSWTAQNNEAEKLMPEIAQQFLKAKKSYNQLTEIIVIKGPGSFTGLRVGVTVANTLAYLTKAKLYAISTFEYWHQTSKLPVVIYAGSKGVYFSKNPSAKPELLNLDEALELFRKLKIKSFCGDISEDQEDFFKPIKYIKSKKNFCETMQKLVKQKLKPQKIVPPLYIKKPQITPSRNQLNLNCMN